MHIMTPTAGALLACISLIACGGAGDWESVRIETEPFGQASAAPASVTLEGCSVDARDRPAAQLVQARSGDGRLVASTTAGADGVTIMTGHHAASMGGCLRG